MRVTKSRTIKLLLRHTSSDIFQRFEIHSEECRIAAFLFVHSSYIFLRNIYRYVARRNFWRKAKPFFLLLIIDALMTCRTKEKRTSERHLNVMFQLRNDK